MITIRIDSKNFISRSGDFSKVQKRLESLGAIRLNSVNKDLEIKELVDPLTVAILVGGGFAWVVYRVTREQKENFRKGYIGELRLGEDEK